MTITQNQRLSKTQRLVLDALNAVDGNEHERWIPARLLAEGTGQPLEGIGRTVASLIRRDLARKTTNAGVVYYRSVDRWTD